MIKAAEDEEIFWKPAKELLHVTPANDICDNIFAELQKYIDTALHDGVPRIRGADSAESALLAVGHHSPKSTLRFDKFSVPGPMLEISENQRKLALANTGSPLELMNNCKLIKMEKEEDGYVRVLETDKGALSWMDSKTKVILCAGVCLAA
jgi:hypothetical protein